MTVTPPLSPADHELPRGEARAARSQGAVRVLLAYIVVLPIHSLVIALLLSQIGLSIPVLRALAAWKEVLLLATLLALAGTALMRRTLPPLVWIDWVAIAWLGQVLVYLALHERLFASSIGQAALYGARDWILYLFPYFIGRLMVVCDRDLTLVLRTLLVVGAVTSAAGVLEYAFVPTRWHIDVGIPRYFGEFLNLHYPDTWGLPTNYWQNLGHRVVRRAVSVYLSGQAFALPFLLLWPLCLLNLRTRWIRGGLLLVALNVVALFLTLTRMTIAVCFLQGLLLFWLIRRRYLVPYMAASAVVAALLVSGSEWIPLRTELPTAAVPETSVAIPQPRLVAEEKEQSGRVSFEAMTLRQMASDTAQFRDSSSNVRLPQWVAGWQMLRAHPAGMGLGSTGNTAGRFGMGGVGSEAGFLKVAGALGFPGLLLFLGWFLGVVWAAAAVVRAPNGLGQGLAILMLVCLSGYLLNSLTVPPDQSLFLAYLVPWLGGMTVSRWARLQALQAA